MQELVDAINGTVVSNNVKGITADSIRNLLLLMAEYIGQGGGTGGDGGVKVFVFDPGSLSALGLQTEFTPELWEELKANLETAVPGISETEFAQAVEEAFTNNAAAFQTMMNKAQQGVSTFGLIDMGKLAKAMIGLDDPAVASLFNYSLAVLASVAGIETPDEQMVSFVPANLGAAMGAQEYNDMVMVLYPNGGYQWMPAYDDTSETE